MRIFLLLMLSMVSYGAATDFSECKGKEANYYVAKFTKNGTANGWLKAARMHQKFSCRLPMIKVKCKAFM